MPPTGLTARQYRALAELRHQLRRYLRESEQAAREAGLEPQQHQFLLAIKGMPAGARCTIGEVAERLQIQHHSTVELVDRLARRGFVQRRHADDDRRQVLLQLTARGEKILDLLSRFHRQELRSAAPRLAEVMGEIAANATARPSRPMPAAKPEVRKSA